ncbi:unnamed protein product [Adineta ricciae]|uniref:FLYWCH-type domain-containing protein n=1 Tax=Adineta ricciae TaxID=249248 RepID=A0A814N4K3_ADIRI|nr:unnamed protein product [Adineta ricciae]
MATDIQPNEYSLAETKRHKPCLVYCGHRYVQDKIQNRTIYWRCEDRSHCNGRAHQLVGNGSLPVLTIRHNHSPIIEDLARHDIVSVDSHRRRRRQNRKIISNHSIESNDRPYSSDTANMSSSIKYENLQKVITTSAAPNIHLLSHPNTYYHRQSHQSFVDPIEMTKLLSNITANNSSIRKSHVSTAMDQPSRLNQFSWEEIEGRYLPVIYRHENGIYHRYTSKMYVENTLFQSESWQRHLALARSLPPLVSYSYTENESKLFRSIIEWHLASVHFKTIPSTDCLIRYEDLLEFYKTLRKLRDTTLSTTYKRPIAPLLPSSAVVSKSNMPSAAFELPTQVISSIKSSPQTPLLPSNCDASLQKARSNQSTPTNFKESGWVQINNVFVPYIVKLKVYEHDLTKCQTRPSTSQFQREFYVPYEILIKCNIFTEQEFSLKQFLIKATQQDFDILNSLISNINIFDEKVPEKTLLVNLHHAMIALDRVLYVKFLPSKQPRTQVNKYHANVLAHKGGTLLMNGNKLIPYIVQNNRFYVPLLYTFQSLPNVLLQAKRGARAPRQYEIDYINLLFIYFSIDIPPLTPDNLLVDIFNIKCSSLQPPVHFRTLLEHQQYEKNKLLNATVNSTSSAKSNAGSSVVQKSNKCQPTNVVVNPMIHHPSFYGYSSSKPTPSIKQQVEIKTIYYEHYSLSAIVKSVDTPVNDWKISIRNILQQFSVDIDYHKFVQLVQANSLLRLTKLDEDERRFMKAHSIMNGESEDYYIFQQHLERCIALLNDLKHGSIDITCSSSSNNELQRQQPLPKASSIGAKKRKTVAPSTSLTPLAISNETDPLVETSSRDTGPSLPNGSDALIVNDTNVKSPHHQATCPIVSDHDDDDDDDMMPVVAFVEEEQPLEGLSQVDVDNSFVIVDSSDCNDERIQLDDTNPSYSSGYESSIALTNTDTHNHEENDENNSFTDSKSQSSRKSVNDSMFLTMTQTRINKKRQRYKFGKSRIRPRSITPRVVKKPRSMEEDFSLVTVITHDQIERHLRTLFMPLNELRRTRTRSVKTPSRLGEETPILLDDDNSGATTEADSNVFDILTSPTTPEPKHDVESNEEVHSPYTDNVINANKSNKLGVTIKKVSESDVPE